MKNSLFKRAMAVASAVPLALTQCLGVANAVDVTDTAPEARFTGESVTLNDGSNSALFYIEPTEDDDIDYTKFAVAEMSEEDQKKYAGSDYVFTKDSVWYSNVYDILIQIGNGDKKSGTIDASDLYASALNKAGKYRDIAEKVVDCIGEMTYDVDAEGNVTIKGDADNVTSVLEEMGQKMVGDSLKNIADKYDMPELAEIKFFDGLEIAGSIEIVVNSSSLKDDNATSATVTFTDKVTGKEYKGIAIRDYVKAQLDAIEATAKKTINDLVEKYDLNDDEFEEMVQDSDEYKELIQNLKDGYTPEADEIENMVLESVEFKNLVSDYMRDHGVGEDEAQAKVMESEKYQEMIDRFTNGINLDEDTIKEILADSPEYEQLVNDYMEENQVDYDTAVSEVLDSAAYDNLLKEFTDKYTYTDEEISEMIKGTDTYVNKLASLRDEYETQYADMKAKANSVDSKITKIVDFANGKLEASDKYIDKVMSYSVDKTADSFSEIIEFVNSKIPAVESKIENVSGKAADKIENYLDGKTIPTSGAAIAANATVQKVYNEVLNTINNASPVAIDISAADWGELADSFTNIAVSVHEGVATFTANLEDKEADAAKAYIEANYSESDYKLNVTDVHKEVEITVDYTALKDGSTVSYDMNIKRVVLAEKEEIVTSSTSSTSTTNTTDTVTTATGSETGTGTETTPTGTGTGTGTETTPTGSETGTGTETTPTGSETGTGTETTPTGSETGTGTETTPTGSGTGTGTETTTTSVKKYVVNIKTEAEVGFYLNTDDEFNKEQLSELKYSVDYSTLYYDGDGELLGQDVLVAGKKVDILDSVEFKDVPGDVFEVNNKNTAYQFATQVPVYATKDIIAEDGTVVAKAGSILKNVNGSNVSVTAYIGIKGDGNLDMKADAEDASLALKWYSASMTGADLETLRFTNDNNILVNSDPMLDEFAVFLSDVNNENDSKNYVMRKAARTIDSNDASFILAYYAKVMTDSPAGKATWTDVLGKWAKK